MNRTLTHTRIDEDKIRYRVRIESDPCVPNTPLYTFLQFEMLRMLSQDPSMSDPGPSRFQKLTMEHDGGKWIVITEAVVKE